MTPKQSGILRYLADRYVVFIPPTEIGEAVGSKPYHSASSWACPTLKVLTVKGLVERAEDRGHYRVTKAGLAENKIRRSK